MDSTFQYGPSPGQPCKAKRTAHAWNQACAPGLNDKPYHGIPLEQPLCVWLAKATEIESPLIPWVWLICTGYPVSLRWFCSCRNWLNLGGSVCLDCHHPWVPSCSLEMTRLWVGSTCWAWCQFSKVIQVTCWLSWTTSRTCRSQMEALIGLVGPSRAASCTAHTAVAVTLRVPGLSGMHPG